MAMTYQQQPSHGYPPPPHGYAPPAGRGNTRLPLIVGSVIAGVFVLALVLALVLMGDDSDEVVPDPISRSELLAEYTDLVPGDSTATEDSVAHLAETTCERLESAVPPSDLIAATADIYRDSGTARQVLRLLVSHGCPSYLDALD